MASVTNPATNPQLAGILASQPMPVSTPRPNGTMTIGSETAGFSIHTQQPAAGSSTSGTTGQVVVGGGTTPAAGAQPPAPATAGAPAQPATTPVTTVTPATTVTPSTMTPENGGDGGAPMPFSTGGFGKAERGSTMTVDMGGAGFSFPSFNSSAKSTAAPAISWGPGWSKVEKNGMWFMEHTNGAKAIPAVEYRVTPKPAEKVSTVKVANGWGKKFPDGTILVFDRKEGPYRLDPQGNKHKVALGTHTFGGVQVRVFEASVVRTLDPSGNVNVFDSRGNASGGSKRGRLAAALGSAAAGASTSGGGKTAGTTVGSGPTDGSGGKTVGGGTNVAALTADVQKLTELARSITAEIRSGNVSPARLTELQAQLSALPAGIAQAAGAAGTMTSNGTALRHGAEQHAPVGTTPPTPPAPGTSTSTATPGSTTPGTTTAQGGGAAAPVAGVDANATSKAMTAGATAKLQASDIPADLNGKQARFAQLPDALQAAVAKAYGSDQGSAAFKADQLVSFAADGTVRLVEGGTVFTKHQAQVRGAGPGEEIALTVRPGRQPGSVGNVNASIARPAAGRPAVVGGGTGATRVGAAPTTMPTTPGVAVSGSGANSTKSIKLFGAGGEFRNDKLGGISGSFTFRTLPAKAREALMAFISNPATAAGKAFASRTGSGWQVDPNATIVIEAGYASFVNGLNLTRGTTPARPPMPTVTGGGPTSQPVGHNATRPPVTGGGATPGIGTVAPGTPPPIPAIADPGERGHVGH